MGPPEAASARRREILPVLASLIILIGCSRTAIGDDQATFVLSTSPTDEILLLRSYGGMFPLAPWYHLYGNGRLVRDIVDQYHQDPIYSHEVQLTPSDIDLLFQLIVGARLPDLTVERLAELAQPQVVDGSNSVLTVTFLSYTRPGEDPIAPFTARVEVHAPRYMARNLPDIPEIQSFATLAEALDGFFPQPAKQVIFGDRYRPGEAH